jgi:hypothetical protein
MALDLGPTFNVNLESGHELQRVTSVKNLIHGSAIAIIHRSRFDKLAFGQAAIAIWLPDISTCVLQSMQQRLCQQAAAGNKCQSNSLDQMVSGFAISQMIYI